MAATPDATGPVTPARSSFADAFSVYLKRRVLVVLFLGFSSGLPLALSGSTLLVWMTESGVNLGTIGLFALVGTPYTIKFLWAPIVDALDVPFLSRHFGRRRGWLLLSQFLLIAAIVFLGFCDPAAAPLSVAFGALLVATASSTQDIIVDAFRVESLDESEQAAGMASYVAAYRIGMLASTAGALFLVSGFQGFGLDHHAAWRAGYAVMAALVLIGVATTLFATEPEKSAQADAVHARETSLRRVIEAAVGAFSEFLSRDMALVALVFVVLYKFTDALSGAMTAPFVIDLGFSRNEYAAIIKGVGLAATLIGGFAGGFVARAYSLPSEPADRRLAPGDFQSGIFLAGRRRIERGVADIRHHRGKFHQRHRHGDLRGLSLGAVPQSAAHRDPIRVAHRIGGVWPDVFVVGRGLHRRRGRLGLVLCDLFVCRFAGAGFARLAATARSF